MSYFRIFVFAVVSLLFTFTLIIVCASEQDFNFSQTVFPRKEKPVSIIIFGDMMLDRNVKRMIDKNGIDSIFLGLQDEIKSADLAVANLEGVFTSNESIALKNQDILRFTFDKNLTSKIKVIGFDAFSQANNHTADFGREGQEESKQTLRAAGIISFGDFWNENVSEEVYLKGKKISLIGFNQFSYKNFENILNGIADAKNKGAFVIVMPHWGEEYKKDPNEFQRVWAHKFIDNGADVVVGAHPHVVQTTEMYNGKPIYYSLGNFVFDQYFSEETMRGNALVVNLGETSEYRIVPFGISTTSVVYKLK